SSSFPAGNFIAGDPLSRSAPAPRYPTPFSPEQTIPGSWSRAHSPDRRRGDSSRRDRPQASRAPGKARDRKSVSFESLLQEFGDDLRVGAAARVPHHLTDEET